MRVANAAGVFTRYKRATALPIQRIFTGITRDCPAHPCRGYHRHRLLPDPTKYEASKHEASMLQRATIAKVVVFKAGGKGIVHPHDAVQPDFLAGAQREEVGPLAGDDFPRQARGGEQFPQVGNVIEGGLFSFRNQALYGLAEVTRYWFVIAFHTVWNGRSGNWFRVRTRQRVAVGKSE